MTEPTYTYVRGQGWVVGGSPDTLIIERYGKRVTATIRQPKPDERYFYNTNHTEYERQFRDENGVFLFEKFVNFMVDRDAGRYDTIGCTFKPGRGYPTQDKTIVFVVFEVVTL